MDVLSIILTILGLGLTVFGIVGCIVPGLPGPPLNYIALILIQIINRDAFTTKFLVWFGVITVVVYLLDYILPILGAKLYNASKYGIWGSIIGMIVGIFFFPPYGLILGVLFGAITGEFLAGKNHSEALKVGFASFFASMLVMVIKLTLSLTLTFYFFKSAIDLI